MVIRSGLCMVACAVIVLGAGGPLDVPLMRQPKNGCGSATVAMVMRYWAVEHPGLGLDSPPPEYIHRELFPSGVAGIRLSDMGRYLDERGYRTFTLRASWIDLEEQISKGRPVIACLRKGPKKPLHYAVVVGLDSRRIVLNDPGRRKPWKLSRSRFEKQWGSADRWILLAVPGRKGASRHN